MFSSLLGGEEPERGFWAIDLDECETVEQEYLRNTPILVTRKTDSSGNAIEIVDFCPRFRRLGRAYRPVALVRTVRPVWGSPRVRVRLRPTQEWGEETAPLPGGSNHIRFGLTSVPMRLTTDAPVGLVTEERLFRLERPLTFFLGPDESFESNLQRTVEEMLANTTSEWREWVRGLATPVEWQDSVIRARSRSSCASTRKPERSSRR